MQVGDIVKIKSGYEVYAVDTGDLGVVIKTDKSLEVTSHCVKVVWPHRISQARIYMLEVISESR